MKDSKNIVIGLLCAVVCIMAVAYAAFSATLNINGAATVPSTWGVTISNISCGYGEDGTGEAPSGVTVEATKLTGNLSATFDVVFTEPGQKAFCEVTITNGGNLTANLTGIKYNGEDSYTNGDNDLIQYTLGTTGTTTGTTELAPSNNHVYTFLAEYKDVKDLQGKSINPQSASAQGVEKSLNIAFSYAQKGDN